MPNKALCACGSEVELQPNGINAWKGTCPVSGHKLRLFATPDPARQLRPSKHNPQHWQEKDNG